MDIREKYRGLIQATTRGRAIEVVDLAIANPVLTARLVAERLGVSGQSGLNILRQVERAGILRMVEPTADRRRPVPVGLR
jgi:hypothetical protein